MIRSVMVSTLVQIGVTCLIGWLIPGGGHIFQRSGSGGLFLVAVSALFGLGLAQDGKLFNWEPGLFGFLKFFADLSIGLPYLIGKAAGWGSGDLHAYGYEYGNTFLYTAGLLNMLLVMDAFDIAQGRKS